jgi:hypothetical protein
LGARAVMPAARPSSRYGVLSWFVPPALAGEVAREAAAERDALLAAAGEKVPRRRDRLLPPWLAVYFTLALCLLARLPYQDALRALAGDGAAGLAAPATTALTAARRRLGERPLELLFQRVTGVLLPSRDPWATVDGLLVVAWDGTTLKVPASPENTAALGRPRGGGKKPGGGKAPPVQGHYPHLRVVALIACGTRALLGAAVGPLADGEQTLAAALTARLRPGMLLLADRAYWGHVLWAQCTAEKESPGPYHSASTAPSPSPPRTQPPGNLTTSTNPPPARQPRLLKFLALGSADGFTALSSCSRLMLLTCGYVLRGVIWGRRRPLCVRGCRVSGSERSADRK